MRNSAFYIGIAVVVVAAIIIGIFTVGGPNTARQDMFDMRRYENLRQIATALHCTNWRILKPELPDTLDLESIRAYCGGVQMEPDVLVDNETGMPYAYTRISDAEYSVCATFHDAHKTMRMSYQWNPGWDASFNPDTGCFTGRVR